MKKQILAGVMAAVMFCTSGVYVQNDVAFAEEKEMGRWARDGSMMKARSYGSGSYVKNGSIHDVFPQSYWSYLDGLKAAHPTWKFEALETGIDWETAVREEMYPTTNLVASGYYPSSWLDLNSFNYGTNAWKIDSDPDWVQANRQTVEAYMDPRNFLNEENIFQFEKLTFDGDTQTIDGVETIISGTFMSHAQVEGEKTYAQVFMEIGKQENVSPYHLASRIRQEQGAGTSALISGTVPGYEGYYNYFNIEAYGETREEIIRNGMNEAVKNGWTSRYLALVGGSRKVAANYIAKAQDTLYLQKFDVDDQFNSMFWHQYMQNLSAAESESNSMRKAYTNMGLINSSFTFKIPVFSNMPAASTQKPQGTGNPNERLKSIQVDEKELINFNNIDLNETTYETTVSCKTSTVDINSTAIDAAAMVSPMQNLNLNMGENKISIRCMAENGAVRDYTVKVIRTEHQFGDWASEEGQGQRACMVCGIKETRQEPPKITDIQFSDVTSKGYKVTVKIENASFASELLFPTWSDKNGQDDITWDSVTPAPTVSYYVETSRHNDEAGLYYTHVYVHGKDGSTDFKTGMTTVPKAEPAITKLQFSDVTSEGYQVTVSIANSSMLSQVYLPTWTSANGQDDITWDQVAPADTISYYVKASRHNNESGIYNTHVYAYDKNGKAIVDGGEVLLPSSGQEAKLSFEGHVQNIGWQNWVNDGGRAGTVGKSLRMEALKIKAEGVSGSVQYRAHVKNIGWQGWKENGALAGTTNKGLQMEAIEIKLTGELAKQYKIQYRAHVQNIGWQNWVEDGQRAGTVNKGLRMEAIDIRLVKR